MLPGHTDNFDVRQPPYDDYDDGGLQTIFSMNYAVLVQELSIYLARWLDCQRLYGIRRKRTRRMKMTNRTYIVVTSISSTIIQCKVPFQIL